MRKHITQVILIGLLVIALWAPKTARAYDDSYPKSVHSELCGKAAIQYYGKIAGHFEEAVLPVNVYCIMVGAHDEDETDHVHEHWNNPVDKQYSRNLGTGDGIERVVPLLATGS